MTKRPKRNSLKIIASATATFHDLDLLLLNLVTLQSALPPLAQWIPAPWIPSLHATH